MIIHPAPQGSAAWLGIRAGKITASELDKLLTAKTRKPSTQRTPYLYRLAAERLLGMADELTPSRAMERGTELEPEARAAYELATGATITEVGLCSFDGSGKVACSPDGLIVSPEMAEEIARASDDHADLFVAPLSLRGGLELKCPGAAKHVEYLLGGVCPDDYVHQVQGCLYVTGAPWWDFMSYYPGLPLFITRVTPDTTYHDALAAALADAVAELDKITDRLRELAGEEEA